MKLPRRTFLHLAAGAAAITAVQGQCHTVTNDDFRDQYARAREEQADKLFREIIEIADDASADYVTTSDGKQVVDHENINRSRLRVDARKWAASKLAPRKYGDRVEHDHKDALDFQPAVLIQVGDGGTKAIDVTPKDDDI